MTPDTLTALERCNKEAFACIANLEAHGSLHEGAMRGIKDQLTEMRLILERADNQLAEDLKLSDVAARTDFSDRECTKLLGALAGGLTLFATCKDVRRAMYWLAFQDKYWELLYYQPMCVDQRALRGEI